MSFSEATFAAKCARLTTGVDPLLNLFFRLHVPSDLDTEADFKTRAVVRLRSEDAYRRWKLPQADVERGLLERGLTPLAFFALARLYGVRVRVRSGKCWFKTAECEESPWVVDARRLTLSKFAGEAAPCEVPNPGKPLNAVSSYTVPQLTALTAALGAAAPKDGTKAALYGLVQRTLADFLTS
jgi:hypothetical protein